MRKSKIEFRNYLVLFGVLFSFQLFAQPIQQWLTVVNSASSTNDLIYGGNSKFPVVLNSNNDKIAVVNNNDVQPMTTSLNTSNGSVIFTNTHLVTANSKDLDFDANDNLFTISNGTNDGYLRKFSPTGTLLFNNVINNANEDNLLSIRSNPLNGCNVHCRQKTTSTMLNTHVTQAYNSSGVFQWSSTISDLDWYYGYDGRMTMDNNGNTIFSGKIQTTQSNPNAYNIIIRKVNNVGVQQWQTTYDFNSLMDHLVGRSLKTDNNGDVYFIDANSSNWSSVTQRLIKLNGSTGAIIYQQQIGIGNTGNELIVNSNGDIIIGGPDNSLKCYNPVNGALIWTLPVTGFQSLSNDINGNIYLTTNTGVSIINSSGTILNTIIVTLTGYAVTHLYTLCKNSGEIYVVGNRILGNVNKVFVAKYSNCSAFQSVNAGIDQTICAGTSVTLSGSGANTYSWNNSVTNGIAFTPTSTTTYILTGTNTTTGCITSDQVVVTVNNLPTTNAGVDQTVCAGSSITLSGTGAITYSWDNGVNNSVSFTPASTATYTVSGTDANGCIATDQVIVNVNQLPTVNAGIDQTMCAGASVTLSGSGANTYSWNNNVSNGVGFNPTVSNEYVVTGTDVNGCLGTDTVDVTVNNPSTSSLTETALDSYTLNGQTYTQSGTYTQVIPNATGCDSTITLNLSLDFTGINETQTGFTIAPNPTMDVLTITSTDALYNEYVLFDSQGRKVLSGTLAGTTTQLNLSRLSRGNYLLQIGEKKTPIKLVKE